MYCFHVFCCIGVDIVWDIVMGCFYIYTEIVRVWDMVCISTYWILLVCVVVCYFGFPCIEKVVDPVGSFVKGNNLVFWEGFDAFLIVGGVD